MPLSAALVLRKGDRQLLGDLAQPSEVPNDLARRARIVLLAADGMPNAQIARTVGVSRPTVIGWRDRYARCGIKGLEDEPRTGRPRVIDEIDVVAAVLANGGRPPARLGLTHWSARSLATELGISFSSVARIWRKWGIQPQMIKTFAFGTEPALDFRVGQLAGLFLDPPTRVIVVSADAPAPRPNGQHPRPAGNGESPGIQALTTALEAASFRTGQKVSGVARQSPSLLAFLEKTVASHPEALVRVVADHHGAAQLPAARSWLQENPGISLHTSTANCAWLDLVGILLGVTAGAAPAKEVVSAIRQFTEEYNDRPGAFTWINPSASLLADLVSAA